MTQVNRSTAITTMIRRLDSVLADVKDEPRYQYGLLAAITLLAMALRFYKLGTWSFWIDELFTLNRVEAHYGSLDVVVRTIAGTKWIPLSLLLISPVLKMLGANEWTARLVPAMIGVASVPALYLPTRRMFGPTVALLAALLLAISPWHIYWSQNARFYTSLMLFSSLGLFAFFFGVERGRPLYLLFFIVLLYLALSERLLALFLVPSAVSYLLLLKLSQLEKPPGLRGRNLLLLALPALILLIANFPALIDLVTTFGGTPNHDPLRLLSSIAYRLGIATISLGLAGGLYLVVQKDRAALFMLLSAVVPVVLILAVSPFMFTVDRYMFAVLPFWLVLSALAIKELVTRNSGVAGLLGVGVLVLVFGTLVSEDALYYEFQRGNRPDWRSAFQFVAQRKLDSDVVAATSPQVGRYYLGMDVMSINAVDRESAANHRIWFLIDESTGGVEPALHQWIRQKSELVDVIVTRMPGKSLDIRIYLYER